MMVLRWFLFVLADLAFLVLAYALAPFLPVFAIGRPMLPRCLAWFQTPDNPLDGDAPYQLLHAPFKGVQVGWRRYINRVFWLWRNPAYGFDLAVLGFDAGGKVTITKRGPSALGGALVTGWFFATAVNLDGSSAWQFYAVKVWGAHASRVNFGWKLWSTPGRCQFAMSVNPWLTA